MHSSQQVGVFVSDGQTPAGAASDLQEREKALDIARTEVGYDKLSRDFLHCG
jgi:hypothetical protein